MLRSLSSIAFSSNEPSTTDTYTLSLHDALPISRPDLLSVSAAERKRTPQPVIRAVEAVLLVAEDLAAHLNRFYGSNNGRSEEHTSELQSHSDLVCRLLLEKKKKNKYKILTPQAT